MTRHSDQIASARSRPFNTNSIRIRRFPHRGHCTRTWGAAAVARIFHRCPQFSHNMSSRSPST